MTYAEELKSTYSEARRRLWSGSFPSDPPAQRPALARPPEPPMTYSGPATGNMWNGVNIERWELSSVRKGREIVRAVLFVTGVRQVDFMSHRRAYVFCEARQLACWFMRHYTGLSAPQVGKLIGGRDHSTVLHSVNRVNARPDLFGPRMLSIAAALRLSLPEEIKLQ